MKEVPTEYVLAKLLQKKERVNISTINKTRQFLAQTGFYVDMSRNALISADQLYPKYFEYENNYEGGDTIRRVQELTDQQIEDIWGWQVDDEAKGIV